MVLLVKMKAKFRKRERRRGVHSSDENQNSQETNKNGVPHKAEKSSIKQSESDNFSNIFKKSHISRKLSSLSPYKEQRKSYTSLV